MKVKADIGDFEDVVFVPASRFHEGRMEDPWVIVIHYTAGGSLESTVRYFAGSDVHASAHFVVGREGMEGVKGVEEIWDWDWVDWGGVDSERRAGMYNGVVQMVRLSDMAFHAGRSSWKGKQRVNKFSIGIEICNWGPLKERGGDLYTWAGSRFYGDVYEDEKGGKWEAFTDFQYEMVAVLVSRIMEKYGIELENVVGHCDVAPHRKIDPGPAWDWKRFRDLVKKLV